VKIIIKNEWLKFEKSVFLQVEKMIKTM